MNLIDCSYFYRGPLQIENAQGTDDINNNSAAVQEAITGYSYEPWHIRYVGDASVAKEIMDKGITLEEYLGKLPTTDVAPPKDE